MPSKTPTSVQQKRRLDEEQQDCQIIDVTPAKRTKITSTSANFFRNSFSKLAAWFRSGHKETLSSNQLFGARKESNSVEEAIAHGGQYIDDATTDKFMHRQYITNGQTGYQPIHNNMESNKVSNSSCVNGSAESAYYSQNQYSQFIAQKPAHNSAASSCQMNDNFKNPLIASACSTSMYNTRSQSQNLLLHGRMDGYNTRTSSTATPYATFRNSDPLSNSSYQGSNDPTSQNCSVDSSANDMTLSSSLQKYYSRKAPDEHTQDNTSVYDRTYSAANHYSSYMRSKSGRRKTLVERCYDLAQKKKYQALIEQFTGSAAGDADSSVTRNSRSVYINAAGTDTPIRKSIFQMKKKEPSMTPFKPQTISTPFVSQELTTPALNLNSTVSQGCSSIHGTPVNIVNRKPPSWRRPPAAKINKEIKQVVSPKAAECAKLTQKLDEIRRRAKATHSLDRKTQERKVAAWDRLRQEGDEDLERMVQQRLKLHSIVVLEDLPVEEKVDEFPVLSEEAEAMVDKALHSHPDAVLSEAFRIKIKGRDLITLKGLDWLNDEVINFYMNLIVDRSEKDDNLPTVYTFNTFFHGKLMSQGHSALKRWTKKVDIFSKQIIVVPVHLGMHWCMAAIDFRHKTIRYFDSMGGSDRGFLGALKRYLEAESLDKKNQPYDTSDWTLECPKKIPQQMNGSDCGVFACKYAEHVSRDAKFSFTQEHMPYFRRRIVYEILTKKLM